MRKLSISFFTLLLMATFLAACSSNSSTVEESDEKTIKLGTVIHPDAAQYRAYEVMKEYVEEESEGQLKIELYGNGELGDEQELAEGTQDGSIEASGISTIIAANLASEFSIWSYPFLIPNEEAAEHVLKGDTAKKVLEDGEKAGLKGLSFLGQGHYMITNKEKPIEKIEDLKNLSIRTMENSILLDLYSALGANPSPMAYSEVYTGLQQGVIDGQVNPPSEIYTMKFYEPQNYISKVTEFYGVNTIVMNSDFYESLDPEEQEIIKKGAMKAQDHQNKEGVKDEQEFLEAIEEEGLEYNEISTEDREEMIDATKQVVDDNASDKEIEYIEQVQKDGEDFE